MKRFSLVLAVLLAGCLPPSDSSSDTLSAAATFYPVAFLASNIGGNRVTVTQVTPDGVEPHDYEPSPSAIAGLYDSSLVVGMGGGVDAWLERIDADLEASGVARVHLLDYADPLPVEDHEEEEEGDHAEHDHGDLDPHVWLDPNRMRAMAAGLRDVVMELDPAGKNDYQLWESGFSTALRTLDADFREGLQICEKRDIVVGHDAFSYLGRAYGITIHTIAGLSPEEEPSPARLAELTKIIREKDIDVVFFESLASPALADTLARETGVTTAVLTPIEGLTKEEQHAGEDYFSLMRKNLRALRSALHCS